MDQTAPTILPDELNSLLGAASAPVLVDLRSADQFAERLIPGAIRRSPADVQAWWSDLPPARPVVIFDLSGGESSRSTVETLLRRGLIVYDALYSWGRSRSPAGAGGAT